MTCVTVSMSVIFSVNWALTSATGLEKSIPLTSLTRSSIAGNRAFSFVIGLFVVPVIFSNVVGVGYDRA